MTHNQKRLSLTLSYVAIAVFYLFLSNKIDGLLDDVFKSMIYISQIAGLMLYIMLFVFKVILRERHPSDKDYCDYYKIPEQKEYNEIGNQ